MIVESSSGERFTLGQAFSRGGEAQIWSLRNEANWVAKLYHRPTPQHEAKLATMLAAPLKQGAGHPAVAWPLQLLYQQQRFVGYLMPRVHASRPLFHYYNGLRRAQLPERYPWPYFLHRTAQNLAAAVELVHAHHHVIGDLNESNVLVNPEALVTLVDTDSFQVQAAAVPMLANPLASPSAALQLYRSPVGKAEFTPPELQGVDFKTVDRTAQHDNFALAVLVFYLLMDGFHPFAGVLATTASVGRVDLYAMRQGYFPYAFNRQIQPPPGAPAFGWLTPALQDAFRRCFVEGHRDPQQRPAAREWRQLLADAEGALTPCTGPTKHIYASHLATCPYCIPTNKRTKPLPSPRRQGTTPRPRTVQPPPPVTSASSASSLLRLPALPQSAAEWQLLLHQWSTQGMAATGIAWQWSIQQARQQWSLAGQRRLHLQQQARLLPERLTHGVQTVQRVAPFWLQWVGSHVAGAAGTALVVGGGLTLQAEYAPVQAMTPQAQLMGLGLLGGLLLGGCQAWVLRDQLLRWTYLRLFWVLVTSVAGVVAGAALFAIGGTQWQQGAQWLAAPLMTTLLGALFGAATGLLQAQLLRQQLQRTGDGRLWTVVNGIGWALAVQGLLWGAHWQPLQQVDERLGPVAGLLGGVLLAGALSGVALVWMLQGARRLFFWPQLGLTLLTWRTFGGHLRRQSAAWGRMALLLLVVVVMLSWWQAGGGEVAPWQALLTEWSTYVGWP